MELECKTFEVSAAELKAGPKGHGRLSGYIATFGNKDRVGDTIHKGAFKDTLETLLKDGFSAYGHDHTTPPIATFDVLREDDTGLWAEMDFHSTQKAQEARTVAQERLERGKSVKMSITYHVPKDGAEYTKDGRDLMRLNVYEAGIVNIPANPAATVVGVKDITATEVSFDDRLTALATEAGEVAAELKHMFELRVKEGRVMAERRRARMIESRPGLAAALEIWDELLAESEPQPKDKDEKSSKQEAQRLYLEYVRSHVLGVTTI